VTAELKEMNLTWGEAQHAAQDRSRWRQIVEALCPIRDEEDYDKKKITKVLNMQNNIYYIYMYILYMYIYIYIYIYIYAE